VLVLLLFLVFASGNSTGRFDLANAASEEEKQDPNRAQIPTRRAAQDGDLPPLPL
jgi:hypothetical protein